MVIDNVYKGDSDCDALLSPDTKRLYLSLFRFFANRFGSIGTAFDFVLKRSLLLLFSLLLTQLAVAFVRRFAIFLLGRLVLWPRWNVDWLFIRFWSEHCSWYRANFFGTNNRLGIWVSDINGMKVNFMRALFFLFRLHLDMHVVEPSVAEARVKIEKQSRRQENEVAL